MKFKAKSQKLIEGNRNRRKQAHEKKSNKLIKLTPFCAKTYSVQEQKKTRKTRKLPDETYLCIVRPKHVECGKL